MLPVNHKRIKLSNSNSQDDNADLGILGDQLIQFQNQQPKV